MKTCTSILAFLLFAWQCSSAQAFDVSKQACSELITQVVGKHIAVNNFKLVHSDNGGVVIAQVCKTLPTDAAKSIAVFAYDAGVKDEKKFVVAVVNTSTRKLVSMYQDAIQEDAVLTFREGSFHIDTARYNLAHSVRAFGIDIQTVYWQGCREGDRGPERRLFVAQGDAIKPVLQDFYISTWSYTKGGATCNGGMGDQSKEEFSYSIAVGNAKTKGLANLHIIGTSSDRKRRPFSYVLRYDGEKYPVEQLRSAQNKWSEPVWLQTVQK
jgi:hypothetical protein